MCSWFLTGNGRLFIRGCVGVTAVSLLGIKIAMNGPLIENYKNIVQMYSKTKPQPLHPDVLAQAQQVMNDCGLSEEQKSRMTFFTTSSHETFHAGVTNFHWGAIIGIPYIFSFKSKDDVNLFGMNIYGKEDIDWDSGGKQLVDSLILSENAKKFAIAREIYSCDLEQFCVDTACLFSMIVIPANIIYQQNKKSKVIMHRHFISRVLFYLLSYTAVFLVLKLMKDSFNFKFQKACHEKISSLGPKYTDGGLEFYSKTLSKHQALRKLMGSNGHYLYQENGNLSTLLLSSRLPITESIKYLQQLKDTVNKNSIS